MIFGVKFGENFWCKGRLVAGGHMTNIPNTLTYSSVISRDSVHIALTIVALNELSVMACDLQNAYLTADCREKIWTHAGPEFGSESGSIMIVKKALYGLKGSGAAFRAHLAEKLHDIGFITTLADQDVWRHQAVKPDGFEYYEYILCFTDDQLAISHDAEKVLKCVQDTFKFKDHKIDKPDDYPGAQLDKMSVDGFEGWTLSSEKYVKAAIKNIEKTLAESNQRLPTKCRTPLSSGYRPELDTSPELKTEGLQIYQKLISILHWAVELGRVDILLETSLMSTHLALPTWGHLDKLHHIFRYLKTNPKRKLFFDPQHPNIDERAFKEHDWYKYYRDAKERLPSDSPKPRGNMLSSHCFVDSDHVGDMETRQSQTGILIFVNRAPILWCSKRQNTRGNKYIRDRIHRNEDSSQAGRVTAV